MSTQSRVDAEPNNDRLSKQLEIEVILIETVSTIYAKVTYKQQGQYHKYDDVNILKIIANIYHKV